MESQQWVKQSEWHGNPLLGLESWMKKFKNPYNGRWVPVYIFGVPDSGDFTFCVSAGANSDYSYSGCFYPEKLSAEEAMARLDVKYDLFK